MSFESKPLPGVTITCESESLQGMKTAVTGEGGDYIFHFLPAGDYLLRFTLSGFQTMEQRLKVSVAQTKQVDAVMVETMAEEITIIATYETISSSTQGQTTFEQKTIEDLPVNRDIQTVALLAPGVAANGGSEGAVNIAGAPGPQSLFMVNGVVVNDTVWGSPFELYVEDAVQETTVSVSGVSAEYGRFVGGVVNMVTKSGGNEFAGSYRLSLDNEQWQGKTPLTTLQEDKVNRRHELTFGGYLWKDRLWFFTAGRAFKRARQDMMWDDTPYPNNREQERYEGKLTFSPHLNHRILGSYMKVDDIELGRTRLTPIEASAIIDRETPQQTWAMNYTGVLTPNFFVEGQYSEREFTFVGSGGAYQGEDTLEQLAAGTSIIHWMSGQPMGNTHIFCSGCPGADEERNNQDYLVKGSLFFSSQATGSHDIVFGYDSFTDILMSNNYQSPSNFRVDILAGIEPTYGPDGLYYPVILPYDDVNNIFYNRILYWPILQLSEGTDFTVDSFFVNDTWRLNDKLSFNLGMRYDMNDMQDGSGATVADDSRLSPRLGVTWDLKGDGQWLVHAALGRYVALVDANDGGSAGGGTASFMGYYYGGAPLNADGAGNFCGPDHPELCQYSSYEAMLEVHRWLASQGGLSNTDLWMYSPALAGYSLQVPSLGSPYSDEYSVGLTRRLGSRGLIRADYVYRTSADYYVSRTDMSTGQVYPEVEIAPGVVVSEGFDLAVYENDDGDLERTYHGVHTQFQYRLSDRLQLGGNYTWSHLYGNWSGENTANGISVSGHLNYPEYIEERWNYPTGDLAQDQRHKLNLFMIWELLATSRHNLSVSWLERYQSGTPYGAVDTIDTTPYVDNPGYLEPSRSRTYFFTPRDAFRTDSFHSTDLSLNYSFFVSLLGTELELYLQPEIQNLFNENAILNPNTTIVTLASFDPFTETPEEGVHWQRGSNFGGADTETAYQLPRQFRLSLGLRF